MQAEEILMDCDEAQEYKKLFSTKLHRIKIFPKEIKFMSDIIITNEKIFLISYDEILSNISATEIHNKNMAQTQKMVFNELWEKYE
jgi:hypothetical protein